eukprot:Selendium_serpulae@DN1175_c0_g1_i1.p1
MKFQRVMAQEDQVGLELHEAYRYFGRGLRRDSKCWGLASPMAYTAAAGAIDDESSPIMALTFSFTTAQVAVLHDMYTRFMQRDFVDPLSHGDIPLNIISPPVSERLGLVSTFRRHTDGGGPIDPDVQWDPLTEAFGLDATDDDLDFAPSKPIYAANEI